MKESADKNDGDTAPPPPPPAMSALYDDLDNMLYSMPGTHDQRELFQSLLRDTEKTGTPPLTGCAIPGIDMSDMNLRMIDLSHANMRKARLADMHIRYSRFNRARLDGASLQSTSLRISPRSVTRSWMARHCRIPSSGAAALAEAKIVNATLHDVHIDNCDISMAKLPRSHIASSHLSYGDIRSADFTDSIITSTKMMALHATYTHFDNALIVDTDFSNSNLYFSSFVTAKLNDVEFAHANLSGANFCGAILTNVDFRDAVSDDMMTDNSTRFINCHGLDDKFGSATDDDDDDNNDGIIPPKGHIRDDC